MRLLVELRALSDCVYDLMYYHKLQGFLYSLLEDSPYRDLHDGRGYKFVTPALPAERVGIPLFGDFVEYEEKPQIFLPKGILEPIRLRVPSREERIRMYYAGSVLPFTTFSFFAFSSDKRALQELRTVLDFVSEWGLGGLRGEGYGSFEIKKYELFDLTREEIPAKKNDRKYSHQIRLLTPLPTDLAPNPMAGAKKLEEGLRNISIKMEPQFEKASIILERGPIAQMSFINPAFPSEVRARRIQFSAYQPRCFLKLTNDRKIQGYRWANSEKESVLLLGSMEYGLVPDKLRAGFLAFVPES